MLLRLLLVLNDGSLYVLIIQKNAVPRQMDVYIPSSCVRTVSGYDLGPSPTLVPARTQILYSVQRFSSSSTMDVALFSVVTVASLSDRPASTRNTL